MPPTKRKRRTKHRGNAAGSIEARGRTGRKPRPEESGSRTKGGRTLREIRPPSWKGAFGKAAFGAAMLFVLLQLGVLGNSDASTASTASLCLFALVGYTPVMYATDRFVYNRRQRQLAQGGKR